MVLSHHVVHPWSSPAMKRTEALTLATTWTDPENTMLNGRSGHRRTDTQFVIPLIGSLCGKDGTLYGEDVSLCGEMVKMEASRIKTDIAMVKMLNFMSGAHLFMVKIYIT